MALRMVNVNEGEHREMNKKNYMMAMRMNVHAQ